MLKDRQTIRDKVTLVTDRTAAATVIPPTVAFPLNVNGAHLLAFLAIGIGLTIVLLPGTFGLQTSEASAAAMIAIFIGLWGTGIIQEYAASILFLFAASVLALAPAPVVFTGFTSQAGWFIFGGLLFGSAVQRSGLGQHIADRILMRVGTSYLSVLCGVTIIAILLSFLMPSTLGRIVIFVPIAVVLAERLGFEPRSNGYTGIVLAALIATTQPCYTVLTGAFPNIAIVGLGAKLYGVEVSYADYLLANFPVMGVLAAAAIPLVLRILFPDRIRLREKTDRPPPLGRDARNTLFAMILALVFWLTDFAHGISPAWVALGAGAFCVMPGIGPIRDVPFSQCLNFNIWFLCCVLIGLGAIADHVGLGVTVAKAMIEFLGISPGNDFINFYLISGVNLVVTGLSTTAGAAAILTPIAGELAEATGWPVLTVLYTQIPALLFFPLPYAMPPVIAGVAMGALRFKPTIKALCALFGIGYLVIMPLHFLSWRVLGYIQ